MTSLPVPERPLRCVALLLLVLGLAGARAEAAGLACHAAVSESYAAYDELAERRKHWSAQRAAALLAGDPAAGQAAYEKFLRKELAALLAGYRADRDAPDKIARLFVLQQELRLLFSPPLEPEPEFHTGDLALPPWAEAELAAFLRSLSTPAGKATPRAETDEEFKDKECLLLHDSELGLELMALPGLEPFAVPAPVEKTNESVVYRVTSDGMKAADGVYRMARQAGRETRLTLRQPFLPVFSTSHPGSYGGEGVYFPLVLESAMPAYAVSGSALVAGTLRRVHTGDFCNGWVEVEFSAPLTKPLLGLLVVGSRSQPTQARVRHIPRMEKPYLNAWNENRSVETHRNLAAISGVDIDDDGIPDLRFTSRQVETRQNPLTYDDMGEWKVFDGFSATVKLLVEGKEPVLYGSGSGTRLGTNVFWDCPE